ncbi:hypothetical protein BASA83_003210 [Batrachochytrium salamandrivorans]|nr:hypothetical protein BASA83_003210 [Batrachochytrium salamandrivorans]
MRTGRPRRVRASSAASRDAATLDSALPLVSNALQEPRIRASGVSRVLNKATTDPAAVLASQDANRHRRKRSDRRHAAVDAASEETQSADATAHGVSCTTGPSMQSADTADHHDLSRNSVDDGPGKTAVQPARTRGGASREALWSQETLLPRHPQQGSMQGMRSSGVEEGRSDRTPPESDLLVVEEDYSTFKASLHPAKKMSKTMYTRSSSATTVKSTSLISSASDIDLKASSVCSKSTFVEGGSGGPVAAGASKHALCSLGDLDALFDAPIKSIKGTSQAKRVALLKPSHSAPLIPKSDYMSGMASSTNLAHLASVPAHVAPDENRDCPEPSILQTPDIRPTQSDSRDPLRVVVSPAKSIHSDVSGVSEPLRAIGGGGGSSTLRPSLDPNRSLRDVSRFSRLASRRKSNVLTFGNSCTIMKSKVHGIEPRKRLEHMLEDQDDDNEQSVSKIDEGLSSSDEDTRKILTIHELRTVGEAKRFKDEMEYFFDGMDSLQMLRVRRSTTCELCEKLLSETFVANIRAHSYTKRLFSLLSYSDDPILLLCLNFTLWILSRDIRNIVPLFSCEELSSMIVLPMTLGVSEDLLLFPPTQKSEKALVDRIRTLINRFFLNTLTTDTNPNISAFQLALDTFSEVSTVRGLLATQLQSRILQDNVFPKVTECLIQCMNKLDNITVDTVLASLLNLLTRLRDYMHDLNSTQSGLFIQCMRVALNFSNSSTFLEIMRKPAWIRVVLQIIVLLGLKNVPMSEDLESSGVNIKSAPASSPRLFEMAILCGSFLVNLLEMHPESAEQLTLIELSPDCPCSTICADKCVCTARLPAIVVIVDLLGHCMESSTKGVDHFVLAAHIAMLFAWTLKQNELARVWVKEKGWMSLVTSVASLLDDFAQFHEQVAAEHTPLSENEGQSIIQTRNSIQAVIKFLATQTESVQ